MGLRAWEQPGFPEDSVKSTETKTRWRPDFRGHTENICSVIGWQEVQGPITSTVHGILQARVLEWVAIPFLQGIFPTQGLNLGLLHCRKILYHLNFSVPEKPH